MKVTLKDVAQKTGLSVTTVSRALNGYNDVALETKQMIEEVATALGYTPNLNARRLKTQRAEAIGLILPIESLRISNPFFSDLLNGIVEQSAQYGLELNVTTPLTEDQVEKTYLNYIRSNRVDGFILVRVKREDARVKLLQQYNYPFVAFGRTDEKNDFSYIDDDGVKAVHQIINYLVSLGHRRIGCITEPDILSKSHNRLLGYKQGLVGNGLPVDPALIVEGNFRQHSGRLSGLKLLDLPNPPTAIVAANDLLALGAMSAIQERGLVVGQDVSVTGYDDIMLAEFANPPLTTLRQPAAEIGAQLCEMLFKQIHGEALKEKQIMLLPSLIVRQSTGPPPQSKG